ncbi:divalent cation tolerance protein CutA [Maribacter sp. R86514]|uniref:divalent cation tolerance protein CutA n=1 Tax=Maribacter sp. R86514 TaxID=3093854 RepID=UPI0037CC1141
MILARIIVKTKKQAEEIARLLLTQKLIYSANIISNKAFNKNEENGEITFEKKTIIEGKTKALLFTTINKVLRQKYPENMPLIYAVPIIYMDDEQIQLLRDQTAKI